jgi:3-phosphoshikimate 1-carboxyvinyltransferase
MGVEIDILPSGSDGCPCSVTLNPPGFPLRPLNFRIPGDISSAAFIIVAAIITPGSQVSLRDVGINPTRTGLLDVLQSMGAWIEIEERGLRQGEPVGDIHVRYSPLQGTQVSGQTVVRMIDEFPAFAVAALSAEGPTLVREAEELRYKETDRITALCQGLRSLGSAVKELREGFRLPGNETLPGGRVDACGDHRLAMAFAVAGLVCEQPVEVQGAETIHESFPNFVESLGALGADIQPEAENVR